MLKALNLQTYGDYSMTTEADLKSFMERSVTLGSKMAGGVAGAAAGWVTGMPLIGAALSPYFANGLERVGKDMIERRLAPRQEMRVGRAIVVAASYIHDRLAHGEHLRDDAFFRPTEGGRSASDEIMEAALAAAMNAAEERKVDYIARLLASIAMNGSIDVATGHQLIATAEQISFRAFVLLEVIHRDEARSYDPISTAGRTEAPSAVYALRSELFGLSRRGLIDARNQRDSANRLAVLGVNDVDPSNLYLTPFGEALRGALEISMLPNDDEVLRHTKQLLATLMHDRSSGTTIDGGTL